MWYQGIELTLQKLYKTHWKAKAQKLDVNPGGISLTHLFTKLSPTKIIQTLAMDKWWKCCKTVIKLKDRIIRPALVRVANRSNTCLRLLGSI